MTNIIATFERSDEFSPFDSKYDRYLKGEYDLTPLEDLGKSLFFSNNEWNFLIDINPTECIKRIITFIVFFIVYSLFFGFILKLIKDYN